MVLLALRWELNRCGNGNRTMTMGVRGGREERGEERGEGKEGKDPNTSTGRIGKREGVNGRRMIPDGND